MVQMIMSNSSNANVFDLSLVTNHSRNEEVALTKASILTQKPSLAICNTSIPSSPDCGNTILSHHHHHSQQIPSLDTSTICTDDSASVSSDTSSVGSVRSCQSTSSTASANRRSLFTKYWKVSGQQPAYMVPRKFGSANVLPEIPPSPTSSSSVTSSSTAPQIPLPADENVRRDSSESSSSSSPPAAPVGSSAAPPAPTVSPRRRSFMPRRPRSESDPTLWRSDSTDGNEVTSTPGTVADNGTSQKKGSKRSCLLQSRKSSSSCSDFELHSCLRRETRFSSSSLRSCGSASSNTSSIVATALLTVPGSGADDNGSTHTTSSVRFDMEAIDVLHFEPPQENYAEEGWSDYFA